MGDKTFSLINCWSRNSIAFLGQLTLVLVRAQDFVHLKPDDGSIASSCFRYVQLLTSSSDNYSIPESGAIYAISGVCEI